MKDSGSLLKRNHRFAIFWGGGLGDALTLRPLLIGLESVLDAKACLFTTATHLPGVFSDLGLGTEVRILPSEPAAALSLLRSVDIRFDWLYLGAYPGIRTRMLAYATRLGRIWNVRHTNALPFIGEQVLADVRALGIEGPDAIHLPYGGRWAYNVSNGTPPTHDYLVLHPGAKDGWETKQWPDSRWTEFLRQLLDATPLNLVLVGVASEKDRLERLCSPFGTETGSRVSIRADLGLPQLAHILDNAAGVVCHNSGVLHLSVMLGKPTVALTGSSANFWRPPYSHVLNVTSGACNLACNRYQCPVPFYRARCIRDLKVDTAMRAVTEWLLVAPDIMPRYV